MELSPETRWAILAFAADIIVRRLGGDPLALPDMSDPVFTRPAGCFVSLHRREGHNLRGCIGMVDATRPFGASIVSAAESVIADPRFLGQMVTREELPELTLEVTLLGPMTKARSTLDFEPRERGIHLTFRGRAGLFLPQVARETGWSREQLLARLCKEKLGVHETAWSEPGAELSTFAAEVVGPVAFVEIRDEAREPSLT